MLSHHHHIIIIIIIIIIIYMQIYTYIYLTQANIASIELHNLKSRHCYGNAPLFEDKRHAIHFD